MNELTDNDRSKLTDTQTEAVEWAERNNFDCFVDEYVAGMYLKIEMGDLRHVKIDPVDRVDITKRRILGGQFGNVSFGDKRMTVEDDRGNTSYVSSTSFPV